MEATKAGTFSLAPQAVCVDDIGQTKTSNSAVVRITAKPAQSTFESLPGRVSTGTTELDRLLLGGIPQDYAIILTAPSSNEREQLIKRFLETGAKAGESTFHITATVTASKTLAQDYPSNFYLIVCNPQADAIIQSTPNVSKLKGVENLTDIDIALTKALRVLTASATVAKRICIDLVSDALLQHHVVNARRWLSALLPILKSKGFTVLAVINSGMHPAEEIQAVVSLFEGEINIYEKETTKGTTSFLKVKKMTGQKYFKDETPLTEEQSKKA